MPKLMQKTLFFKDWFCNVLLFSYNFYISCLMQNLKGYDIQINVASFEVHSSNA